MAAKVASLAGAPPLAAGIAGTTFGDGGTVRDGGDGGRRAHGCLEDLGESMGLHALC